MKIASIDIGSNTVLLLIASLDYQKIRLTPLLNCYRSPRISKGLLINNSITNEKINELMKVLEEYLALVRKHNCEKIFTLATNAFRIAENSQAISEFIKEKLGLEIHTVSGDEEAYLSYLGARSSFPTHNNTLIMDIGGGSTEIILGDQNGIIFKKSYSLGVVNLAESFFHNIKPANEEILSLQKFIASSFSGLNELLDNEFEIIAIAGTPTTISCINQGIKKYSDEMVEGSTITFDQLELITEELRDKTPAEISFDYGEVVSGRDDVIFAGSLLLLELMKLLKAKKILVSSRGVRYGAIIDYMNSQLNIE